MTTGALPAATKGWSGMGLPPKPDMRPAVWLVMAALLAVFGTACGRESPSLILPGVANSVEVGVPRVHIGDRWSIGMEGTVCLDKPGKVELTDVALVRPRGVRVIGFGLRPNPSWKPRAPGVDGYFLGEEREPLRALGFTGRTVDAVCNAKTGAGYEVAVRLLKTTRAEAGAAGWTVSYSSDGGNGTLQIPFAVELCKERSADARPCQRFRP